MSKELPNLIFFGTPEFAVPSFDALLNSGAHIRLAVTQPDRPKGRGKVLAAPPVKRRAAECGVPVYQPFKIRDPSAIEYIASFGAECAVVVAYGQLLPSALLDRFPLGVVNVHASLLPRHRGAAPIQRALLAGDDVTGVSIMLLDEGMDSGPILSMRETPIEETLNFEALHDRLAVMGAELLCETLEHWKAGRIQPVPQDASMATYAPPVRKEELRLDWRVPARLLVNRVRAFDPVPGAYFVLRGLRIKCFDARLLPFQGGGRAGEVVGESEWGLVVQGGDGACLSLGTLQREGQRKLTAAEFLRGHPLEPGTVLQ